MATYKSARNVLSKTGTAAEHACMMGCDVAFDCRDSRGNVSTPVDFSISFSLQVALVNHLALNNTNIFYSNYGRVIDQPTHACFAFDENFPDGHVCRLVETCLNLSR